MSKSEKQKMLDGELYDFSDPVLVMERQNGKRFNRIYNQTTETEDDKRVSMLKDFLGSTGEKITIKPPVTLSYGYNLYVGENFYADEYCWFMDDMEIRIGDNCMLGPAVHVYAATHSLNAKERNSGVTYSKPVFIGNNVWIGGRAVINPGVKIGDNVVIDSGSIVTKDVPSNVHVGGNPARIIKEVPL